MAQSLPSSSDNYPTIEPSGLGEFVKRGNCPRYGTLRFGIESVDMERDWNEAFRQLNPILSHTGARFEEWVYEELEDCPVSDIVDSWNGWESQPQNVEELLRVVRQVGRMDADDDPVLLEQLRLSGEIGDFFVAGDADVVSVWPGEENTVHMRVLDIKSSKEEKTHHQIQTACYTILLSEIFEEHLSLLSVDIDAGILCRETDIEPITELTKQSLPDFDPSPRESDVKRLLQGGGPLAKEFADNSRPPHQFDSNCTGCPYNEVCYTEAVEETDIRLLGLTRSEQRAFRNIGITEITEVAKFLRDSCQDAKPYDYTLLKWNQEYEEIVESLVNRYGLTESRIQEISQQAQSYLGETTVFGEDEEDSELRKAKISEGEDISEFVHSQPWRPWQQGSGDGGLPEDMPQYSTDLGYEEGELIRVYLTVQQDFSRSRLLSIGCQVDCTAVDSFPISFSQTVSDIPDPESKTAEQEREMMSRAIPELFDAMQAASEAVGKQKLPVHFYFFTQQEYNSFFEAAKRHDAQWSQSICELLSLRSGVDQQIFSIVEQEIENRQLKKQPSLGLLQAYERSFTDDEVSVSYDDWMYERRDSETVNLRDVFRLGLFDYSQPYTYEDDGTIRLHFSNIDETSGYYPIQGRSGAQIPLEYYWGCKEIDKLSEDLSDSESYTAILDSYRWHDRYQKDSRISTEDINVLCERFAAVLEHVERSIGYKNSEVEKEPVEIQSIQDFEIPTDSLSDSCHEYQHLEFESSRSEQVSQFRQSVKSRVMNGAAIPLRVINSGEGTTENGYTQLEVKAELLYEEFDFEDPTAVARSCKYAPGESGSGEWMIASPIVKTEEGYTEIADSPQELLHSTEVTLESFDPDSSTAILTANNPFPPDDDTDFELFHKDWTTNPGEDGVVFDSGSEFVLDSKIDDYSADKAQMAVETAESGNTVYKLIHETLEEDSPPEPRFTESGTAEFLQLAEEALSIPPNEKQTEYIQETSSWISLLQGPPGTGKTSGAVSTALGARLYDYETSHGEGATGLVTGASNKSIDELLEDTAETITEIQSASETTALSSVALVRLTGKSPDDAPENVHYVDYHTDQLKTHEILTHLINGDSELSSLGNPDHLVLFATPARMYGIAKRVSDLLEETLEVDIDTQSVYGNGTEQWFDVIGVDEGSMLPLPRLFLATSFLSEDGQLLVSGDHRQMPPVQKHDWGDESRTTTNTYTPYLSTLDFFRLLRGEDVENTDEESKLAGEANVPITRLETTYRCHEAVADFLQKWVYSKDDIEYTSTQTEQIPEIDSENCPGGIEHALSPDSPITLVLHDEQNSKQSNYIEANIITELVDALPESESTGVVTPHNAQKGLISNLTQNETNVDTVERFQGGQRDVMMLSATVSDPDYIEAEEDFLMDLRRINVAVSRMKKKLVVVAPRTIFEVLPDETDQYEESLIWKGIYDEVDATESADWAGDIEDLTAIQHAKSKETDITVEVYNKTH